MPKISTAKAKINFSEVVDRAVRDKERVILTRNGKDIAAVVPIKDYTFLEELEDLLDVQAARAAEEEAAEKGEAPIPWKTARKLLGS